MEQSKLCFQLCITDSEYDFSGDICLLIKTFKAPEKKQKNICSSIQFCPAAESGVVLSLNTVLHQDLEHLITKRVLFLHFKANI